MSARKDEATEQAAREMLLDWAVERFAAGDASLSELAAESGLAIEAIAEHAGQQRREEATAMYLASARRLAETLKAPEFYKKVQRAVRAVERG